jgi:hypothetical protein
MKVYLLKVKLKAKMPQKAGEIKAAGIQRAMQLAQNF